MDILCEVCGRKQKGTLCMRAPDILEVLDYLNAKYVTYCDEYLYRISSE
jgi:hypothetical protein